MNSLLSTEKPWTVTGSRLQKLELRFTMPKFRAQLLTARKRDVELLLKILRGRGYQGEAGESLPTRGVWHAGATHLLQVLNPVPNGLTHNLLQLCLRPVHLLLLVLLLCKIGTAKPAEAESRQVKLLGGGGNSGRPLQGLGASLRLRPVSPPAPQPCSAPQGAACRGATDANDTARYQDYPNYPPTESHLWRREGGGGFMMAMACHLDPVTLPK